MHIQSPAIGHDRQVSVSDWMETQKRRPGRAEDQRLMIA